MNFSSREIRDAFGLFPTGVAVVTARSSSGFDIGVTVNSFTSVSLDPPLVSFNASKSLGSLDDLRQAQFFAVNCLSKDQSLVSSSFAQRQGDKWACTERLAGYADVPVIPDSLAIFECERFAEYEAGDHFIIVGRVAHFEIASGEEPLVFYRGGYRCLSDIILKKI